MRILLVDDDDMLLNSVKMLFEQNGHTVVETYTDTMAHRFFRDQGNTFDLVLCDWDLGLNSKQNGGEVVAEMMKWNDSGTRFVIWSGLSRDVPDGVKFFTKSGIQEILDYLEEVQ